MSAWVAIQCLAKLVAILCTYYLTTTKGKAVYYTAICVVGVILVFTRRLDTEKNLAQGKIVYETLPGGSQVSQQALPVL